MSRIFSAETKTRSGNRVGNPDDIFVGVMRDVVVVVAATLSFGFGFGGIEPSSKPLFSPRLGLFGTRNRK